MNVFEIDRRDELFAEIADGTRSFEIVDYGVQNFHVGDLLIVHETVEEEEGNDEAEKKIFEKRTGMKVHAEILFIGKTDDKLILGLELKDVSSA